MLSWHKAGDDDNNDWIASFHVFELFVECHAWEIQRFTLLQPWNHIWDAHGDVQIHDAQKDARQGETDYCYYLCYGKTLSRELLQ